MMLALTKPKFFIPVHGEHRMLVKHAELGKLMGVAPKNVVVAENGKVIEITKKSIKCEETVQAGAILVDGSGVGEVGSVVLRDRHRLTLPLMPVQSVICWFSQASTDSIATRLSSSIMPSASFTYIKPRVTIFGSETRV